MSKEKTALIQKIKYWLTSHPWLKIIALALAIIVWLYVRGEINRFNF